MTLWAVSKTGGRLCRYLDLFTLTDVALKRSWNRSRMMMVECRCHRLTEGHMLDPLPQLTVLRILGNANAGFAHHWVPARSVTWYWKMSLNPLWTSPLRCAGWPSEAAKRLLPFRRSIGAVLWYCSETFEQKGTLR